jgi:hypothetical protein
MVQLVDSDIRTRNVLAWKGVHVLHFMGSSCSQKLRIFLNLSPPPDPKNLSASEAPRPRRHHVAIPGDIIPECLGDFVGIRRQAQIGALLVRR